eukprot:3635834-Pyramimonas_sp.AAC.1
MKAGFCENVTVALVVHSCRACAPGVPHIYTVRIQLFANLGEGAARDVRNVTSQGWGFVWGDEGGVSMRPGRG